MKKNPDFKIVPVEDMGALGEDALNRIVSHEREAYGYEGFGEYLFCTDRECRRIQSVDEVYGVKDTEEGYVPLKELEKGGPDKRCCPECGSDTLLVFDPLYFRDYLKGLFQGAYGAVIMDGKEDVQGSTFAKPDKLLPFFRASMDYKETFSWETFRKQVQDVLSIEAREDTDMLIWNRVSIARPFRGGENFNRLVGTAFNIHPEYDDWPSMGATRFDSALYPILKPAGFKNVDTDPLGTVSVGIDKIGKFREALNLPFENFKQKFATARAEVMEWQRTLPKQEKKPKFYKGAAILDHFQSIAEKNKQTQIEGYEGADITPELVRELGEKFREIFSNGYGYGQWIFYPSDEQPLSPQQVFKTDHYFPLSELDTVDLGKLKHPETGESPVLCHDPKTLYEKLLKKLAGQGQLAILKNSLGKILAFSFGYRAAVQEAFQNEEWENPVNYSGVQPLSGLRSFEFFLEALNQKTPEPLQADSPVYVWNCMAVDPELEGRGELLKITKKLFSLVPEEWKQNLMQLGEVPPGTKPHHMFKKAGMVEVPALGKKGAAENKIVIVMGALAEVAKNFSLSTEEFHNLPAGQPVKK